MKQRTDGYHDCVALNRKCDFGLDAVIQSGRPEQSTRWSSQITKAQKKKKIRPLKVWGQYLISFASLVDGQVASPFGSGSWRRQEIDGSAVGSTQLSLVLFVPNPKYKRRSKQKEKNGNQVFLFFPSFRFFASFL